MYVALADWYIYRRSKNREKDLFVDLYTDSTLYTCACVYVRTYGRARYSSRVIDFDGVPAERGDPSKFSAEIKRTWQIGRHRRAP